VLKRFAGFLSVFQSVLFLGHFFLFETLIYAWGPSRFGTQLLGWSLALLSISFLGASLLGFKYYNVVVRTLYKIGAVWLGTFNYLFLAGISWWVIFGALSLDNAHFSPREVAAALFGLALIISLYGVVNAGWTRVRRITVRLAGLPEWWNGRSFALISDLHLGNVRNTAFMRRVVRKIVREKPEMVIIAGDLFDGTPVDAVKAAAPLAELKAPLGTFFCEGNHEELTDPATFIAAIKQAGVRVLENENVNIRGLQLIGVPYRHATHTEHMQSVLAKLGINRSRASILITHAPDRPQVAEAAGISLQVSGHTHRGQFFPFTLLTGRMYRQFVYGLSRIGGLQVYTSCGAGTWGPPLRVGSTPEIVMIQLETAV
jgi:predicted MPP superfamily phosphohydrolase